jgi:plasmid stabilization system protein ParE
MTLEIRLRPEAEIDLEDAAIWYAKQSTGLGRQFLDETLASLTAIAESPLLYPLIHRNTRRALMRRFPFGVYYRVDPYAEVVVAIMHGSRDPQRWQSRR